MGKAGEKQKRRPKIKDKRQSERFKEAARKLGADQPTDVFDRVVAEMARPKLSPSIEPPCPKCGMPMRLGFVEPVDQPGHEKRFYECLSCKRSVNVMVRVP
jgi:hypothetical protein